VTRFEVLEPHDSPDFKQSVHSNLAAPLQKVGESEITHDGVDAGLNLRRVEAEYHVSARTTSAT